MDWFVYDRARKRLLALNKTILPLVGLSEAYHYLFYSPAVLLQHYHLARPCNWSTMSRVLSLLRQAYEDIEADAVKSGTNPDTLFENLHMLAAFSVTTHKDEPEETEEASTETGTHRRAEEASEDGDGAHHAT